MAKKGSFFLFIYSLFVFQRYWFEFWLKEKILFLKFVHVYICSFNFITQQAFISTLTQRWTISDLNVDLLDLKFKIIIRKLSMNSTYIMFTSHCRISLVLRRTEEGLQILTYPRHSRLLYSSLARNITVTRGIRL